VAEKEGKLRGLADGKGVQWHWFARCSHEGRYLVFYAYSPVYVKSDRRAAAAEYLSRANWGLYFGNFEMDWSDGQVCFRTSIPLGPAGVTVQALERLVWTNGSLMDRYLPGLLAVVLGDASPEQALLEAERDLRPPDEPTAATDGTAAQPEAGNGQSLWPRRFSASDN
jgi:hypothetical protein